MANRGLTLISGSSSSGGDESDNWNPLESPLLENGLESGGFLDCSDNDALTCQDAGGLREALGVPPECDFRFPGPRDDCHDPPPGYFTVFLGYFVSGLLLPPQPLLVDIVKSLGISFSQLTPNAIIVFMAFCHKMVEIQMPLSVELFHSLFLARRRQPDSYIYFQPRANCKFLSRIPSPRSFWRSQYFFLKDCGWGVPVVWSSGLQVIAMRATHHAFQLQCRALGLFDNLFDPKGLIVAGNRIDLATIRARKNAVGRRSPFAGSGRLSIDRGAHVPRDPARREVLPVRSESARGSESHAHKRTDSFSSTRIPDSKAVKGDGGEARKRVEARQKTSEEELRPLKKNRVEDPKAASKIPHAKHIFVDGVNHREKADSFWDLNDPEIGWKKGRSIVGDFDMLHLMSQSTDSFAHSLAWNSCQGLSLASAMRVREEKLRNDQDKLREEVARLKEENHQLSGEKEKANVELLQVLEKLVDKLKDFAALEEKYAAELKTGSHFLDSEVGKVLLKSMEDKGVQTFKASSAFREEVIEQAMAIHDDVVRDCRYQLRNSGRVSEEIVMLIEPSVPEVDVVTTDDIPLGDAEMIDALKA